MSKKDVMCFVCDGCGEEIELEMTYSNGNCFLPDDVSLKTAKKLEGKEVVCKECECTYTVSFVETYDLVLN